ncbi:MAG: nucleoside-diphosphate sugar epimerase/dehydratase [Longimicrobiales bacterium]|nr:nucleoside-diphosphate sugar epimerase/dehydratase [Longimicrobiales bacterium]
MSVFEALFDLLLRVIERHRRAVATALYSGTTAAALSAAFLARFEFDTGVLTSDAFVVGLCILVPLRLAANYFFRMGLSRWRYVGLRDLPRLLTAVTAGSALFWLLTWGVPGIPRVPRSVVLLEWVFSGYLIGGMWVAYRLTYEVLRGRRATSRTRVLVVGAGEAGQLLVNQMHRSGTGLVPVALVDDNPFRWGTLVHGVEVIGAVKDVQGIAEVCRADQILIAIPSATPEELRAIVEVCETTNLPLKILPGVGAVLMGEVELNQVRGLEIEDLLGRDPVRLDLPELAEDLGGKTVLVTGAAGSIGSELVRQIAANSPGALLLLDQAETPLYFLELELRRSFPDLHIEVVVGSVTNLDTLDALFDRHRPHRVFHAAAYKHVPMMETNPWEAVRNNVLGTYQVARKAAEAGAEAFLLISTDKAVRPSNVMGASKQLAERACLHLQARHPEVAFRAVRFGNVLGSSGSVIPLFRQQLERGEPLTVTDEGVTRYFMTIPEAVQLVLQASVLVESWGRVAMLDMGEPMRILDLARNLLRLSGQPYRPGENVIITGLRPGEKLHEELSAPEEKVWRTSVERVSVLETPPGFAELPSEVVTALEEANVSLLVDYLFSEFPGLGRRTDAPTAVQA